MNKKRLVAAIIVITLLLSLSPSAALAKGRPPTPEASGNNLSVPVIWSEGTMLSLPGTMLEASLTVPYDNTALPCGEGALAYAQKTAGNVWQAKNEVATGPVTVNEIDWGDSLESVDMKVGRPVRVELSLYKTLETPMTGYTMVMLANPSSPDEVQGACATGDPLFDNGANIFTYDSYEATVYSPKAKLIIQPIYDPTYLAWDSNFNEWVGDQVGDVGVPIDVTFTGELNVGGKVIYGLSEGGWKPNAIGDYRITFFLPTATVGGKTLFDEFTAIRLPLETELIVPTEEGGDVGGEAYVDPANNLTYIDVTVGGGGGGGGRK